MFCRLRWPPAPPRAPTGRAGRGHSGHSASQTAGAAWGRHNGHLRTAESSQPVCCLCPQRPACAGGGTPGGLQPAVCQEASPSLLPKPQRNQEAGGARWAYTVTSGPPVTCIPPTERRAPPLKQGPTQCSPGPAAAAGTLGSCAHRQPTRSENGLKRKPCCAEQPEGAGTSLPAGQGCPPTVGSGANLDRRRAPGRAKAQRRPEAPSGGPRKSAPCWPQDPVGRMAAFSGRNLGIRLSNRAGNNARPWSRKTSRLALGTLVG